MFYTGQNKMVWVYKFGAWSCKPSRELFCTHAGGPTHILNKHYLFCSQGQKSFQNFPKKQCKDEGEKEWGTVINMGPTVVVEYSCF